MSIDVVVQMVLTDDDRASAAGQPDEEDLSRWAQAALSTQTDAAQVTIRVVGEAEGQALNRRWRSGATATNVLSFPLDAPVGIEQAPLFGDIVICAPVVEREAAQQCKSRQAHWAHMVVHGCLHLLGMDHIDENDAQLMEHREIAILARLGFTNPYISDEQHKECHE